ncbi:MAG: hypothetical protein KatS3mg087_0144 [Patescibacteria group bacterium]|nr:MAG: hypothetical protein KatS3mg087_0144 [Patescibacteria group bacterium]
MKSTKKKHSTIHSTDDLRIKAAALLQHFSEGATDNRQRGNIKRAEGYISTDPYTGEPVSPKIPDFDANKKKLFESAYTPEGDFVNPYSLEVQPLSREKELEYQIRDMLNWAKPYVSKIPGYLQKLIEETKARERQLKELERYDPSVLVDLRLAGHEEESLEDRPTYIRTPQGRTVPLTQHNKLEPLADDKLRESGSKVLPEQAVASENLSTGPTDSAAGASQFSVPRRAVRDESVDALRGVSSYSAPRREGPPAATITGTVPLEGGFDSFAGSQGRTSQVGGASETSAAPSGGTPKAPPAAGTTSTNTAQGPSAAPSRSVSKAPPAAGNTSTNPVQGGKAEAAAGGERGSFWNMLMGLLPYLVVGGGLGGVLGSGMGAPDQRWRNILTGLLLGSLLGGGAGYFLQPGLKG